MVSYSQALLPQSDAQTFEACPEKSQWAVEIEKMVNSSTKSRVAEMVRQLFLPRKRLMTHIYFLCENVCERFKMFLAALFYSEVID